MASSSRALAQDAPPPVSIGAGLQTAYYRTSVDGADDTDALTIDHARIYVSGTAASRTKFMFNTDYYGADNKIGVMDAVAQFEFSSKANIWAGRFLPPSDRANLYGPFYSNSALFVSDSVQDTYPFVFQGRQNGVMYWGQFDKVKVSGGAFDGSSANGDPTLISAGRVQVDFWDPEDGYYLNGTYYGAKNLLAIGIAAEAQGSDKTAWSADFLLEKKVAEGGAFTVEAEYANYAKLICCGIDYGDLRGGYVLASYVFPMMAGPGKWQVLGKFADAKYSEGPSPDYEQKTTEINLNYIIKEFNSRVMIFFQNADFDAVVPDTKRFGVLLQIQM
jgi:hypothetical protein